MPKLKLVNDNTSTGDWIEVLSAASSARFNPDASAAAIQSLKEQIESLKESHADWGSDADISMDTREQQSHTQAMSDVTIDQIDQKISAIEERMDKRVERIEKETDRRSVEFQREIEIRDAAFKSEQTLRDKALDERFSSFFAVQAERDKSQLERDKRYELLADRVTKAAEGAEEAAKQAATVKANYWAAVGVQLLAVVAILVGAYYANQANVLGAMQTTMSAIQAGKDGATPAISPPLPPPEQQKK